MTIHLWSDDFPALDEPVVDVLGQMRARTDAAAKARESIARFDAARAAVWDADTDAYATFIAGALGVELVEYNAAQADAWLDGYPNNHADADACEELYGLLADEGAADAWLESYRADEQREYDPAVC